MTKRQSENRGPETRGRILFLLAGERGIPSTRVRALQYVPLLVEDGFDVRLVPHTTAWATRNRVRLTLHRTVFWLRALWAVPWADVVFIQKLLLPPLVLVWMRRMGKRIVFEFDDAIHLGRHLRPNPSPRFAAASRRRFEKTLALSDVVTFTSPEFEDLVSEHATNFLVVPGPIDTGRFPDHAPRSRGDRVVIGWIGSTSTTPYLNEILPALREVRRANPSVEFCFIGADPAHLDSAHEAIRPWSEPSEVGLLGTFDIGIAPLPDDEWTRLKGGYKVLQYMAAGLPVVASPVGMQRDFVEDGVSGIFASSPDDWVRALLDLASDPGTRSSMGRRGREMAERRYSLDVAYARLGAELRSLTEAGHAAASAHSP